MLCAILRESKGRLSCKSLITLVLSTGTIAYLVKEFHFII